MKKIQGCHEKGEPLFIIVLEEYYGKHKENNIMVSSHRFFVSA